MIRTGQLLSSISTNENRKKMKTYIQRLSELRQKALREVEAGLNDENPTTRFVHSLYFLNMSSPDDLKETAPESPDEETWSEVIEEEKPNEKTN